MHRVIQSINAARPAKHGPCDCFKASANISKSSRAAEFSSADMANFLISGWGCGRVVELFGERFTLVDEVKIASRRNQKTAPRKSFTGKRIRAA
jgi:hypothetical protein